MLAFEHLTYNFFCHMAKLSDIYDVITPVYLLAMYCNQNVFYIHLSAELEELRIYQYV